MKFLVTATFVALAFFGVSVANAADLIPHEVIKNESTGNTKLSIDVLIPLVDDRLPNEAEIAALSEHLVSKNAKHGISFVTFYLPHMEIDAGAFATAHHNPNMEVKLMPFMLMRYPEYDRFLE